MRVLVMFPFSVLELKRITLFPETLFGIITLNFLVFGMYLKKLGVTLVFHCRVEVRSLRAPFAAKYLKLYPTLVLVEVILIAPTTENFI